MNEVDRIKDIKNKNGDYGIGGGNDKNNMIKKYKIEEEYKKNNYETNKKEKRNRSYMPKITPKSSEIKIKYSVKERKREHENNRKNFGKKTK